MKRSSTILSVIALVAIAPIPALAEAGVQEHVLVSPEMVTWKPAPPALPKGAEFAILAGDPNQQGQAFVMRVKFPANYQVPAHWHPSDEYVTVLSGTLNIGLGDQLDRAKGHALGTGGLAMMPAKTHHFAWVDTETVIQVNAMGPWGLNYVNPSDDPRASQASN